MISYIYEMKSFHESIKQNNDSSIEMNANQLLETKKNSIQVNINFKKPIIKYH